MPSWVGMSATECSLSGSALLDAIRECREAYDRTTSEIAAEKEKQLKLRDAISKVDSRNVDARRRLRVLQLKYLRKQKMYAELKDEQTIRDACKDVASTFPARHDPDDYTSSEDYVEELLKLKHLVCATVRGARQDNMGTTLPSVSGGHSSDNAVSQPDAFMNELDDELILLISSQSTSRNGRVTTSGEQLGVVLSGTKSNMLSECALGSSKQEDEEQSSHLRQIPPEGSTSDTRRKRVTFYLPADA